MFDFTEMNTLTHEVLIEHLIDFFNSPNWANTYCISCKQKFINIYGNYICYC